MVGVWYATSRAPDVFENLDHQPLAVKGEIALQRTGRYGAYINIEQQVTGSTSKTGNHGLSLFFNAVTADDRTSRIDRQLAVGASYLGVPWRPRDTVAAAFSITQVNGRIADGERLQNAAGFQFEPIQAAEYTWEIDYAAQAVSWLSLRPNLQIVMHPDGVSSNPTAIVLGLKAIVAL